MIRLTDLTARSRRGPKVDLGPATFELPPQSCTALVGLATDGVELLLAVLAGEVSPRHGSVTVAGTNASARTSVAYVPLAPELPGVLTVAEYLDLAAQVRRETQAPPRERLATLGVAPLADRRIGRLTLDEMRTVALTEALTSRATVLLLVDPLFCLDPRAVGHVPRVLATRVQGGATAVLSTASRADARRLASESLFFNGGKVTGRASAEEAWRPQVGARGIRLRIRSEGARYLLAELAADPTFHAVQAVGAELRVTGSDPLAMAAAVATATRHANVELDLLAFEPLEAEA